MTTKEIAAWHGVSLGAVKYHVGNALQKLGFRDRRALRNWTGVPRDSALALFERTEEAMTKLAAIGQVSRKVRDIEQSKAWYGDKLGLTHLYTFGKLAFFDCNGTRLYLQQTDEPPQQESILYFRVPDIQAAFAELMARGVVFQAAPHLIHRHGDGTEEWMAFFDDPEGRPLAIMAQVAPRGSLLTPQP